MNDLQFPTLSRRGFCRFAAAAGISILGGAPLQACDGSPFRLRYILASCLYGTAPLAEILPEVHKTGAESIEIWAAPHGNQREQIDAMGPEAFLALLEEQKVKLGSFTCFKYGIFNMQGEMKLLRRLGGDLAICNTHGPKNLNGEELKREVKKFADELRPHVEFAEDLGITIGVENHGGGLISSRDSILWLFEMIASPKLGLAMAPAHLPQDAKFIAQLIRDLDSRLVHFQAWENGMGFMSKLPKDQELMQLPHRGPLDWGPIIGALQQVHYSGRTEIFMHPTPRGVPILETTGEVTAELNAARAYLDGLLALQNRGS